MKNGLLIALLSGCCITAYSQTTPVTQFGSNPWFSTELYPQDLLLRSGNYMFYSPQYFNQPYWGDIDEPEKKPTNSNADYTITGVDIVRDGGSFKHSGAVHTFNNNLGYAWQLSDKIVSSLAWDYNVDARRNWAEGEFTTLNGTYPQNASLPFEYSMRHTLFRLSMNGMLATAFRGMPMGIKIDGGMENTMALNKDLAFSKLVMNPDSSFTDSVVDYSMSGDNAKAFWGWTEPGCSHPFGPTGTQGDSWLQNEYAVGPVYHVNILGGVTHSRLKAGVYFRYRWGHQNWYRWAPSGDTVANDPKISDNFIGEYKKSSQARINRTGEGRIFGNIRLRGNDRFSLNAFSMLTYHDSTLGSASAANLEAESDRKNRIRSVGLECDPNLSVKLGDGLNYIDAALLCRYQYSRYGNVDNQNVGGGELTVYQTHTVGDDGWEDYQERFSYANKNVFDLGADIATMFPLISRGIHHLSLNLRLFGDVRFSYQREYFVSYPQGAGSDFRVNNTRLNLAREVMFNTFLMLQYVQGPFQLRLQFTKPVLYSIAPYTSVYDANGSVVDDGNNYPLKKSDLWITREGMNVALFGSYDIALPFLRF